MKEDKPLEDCFKCCICLDAPGFMPNWGHWSPGANDQSNFVQPLVCKRCTKAFDSWRSRVTNSPIDKMSMLEIMAWVSKHARDAEHRRMSNDANAMRYELENLRLKVANLNRLMASKEELK